MLIQRRYQGRGFGGAVAAEVGACLIIDTTYHQRLAGVTAEVAGLLVGQGAEAVEA